MRLPTCRALLLLAILLPASHAGADEPYVAESAEQIRPLLIGADIPDVTLVTPDYHAVKLREVVAERPAILVYYRGGW